MKKIFLILLTIILASAVYSLSGDDIPWHPLQHVSTDGTGATSVDANANDIIDESDLTYDVDAIDTPNDGEILSYNQAQDSFEWVPDGTGSGYWARSGTYTYLVNEGDNVGIGTSMPGNKLSVDGNISVIGSGNGILVPSGDTSIIRSAINALGPGGNDAFRIRYDGDYIGGTNDFLVIEKTDANGADPDGGIVFANTGNDGVVETALIIRGISNNVGINMTDPQSPLAVNGIIESTKGGIKFPDGTIQTSAGGATTGQIAAFSGSCPSGWSEYTAGRGRYIVGTPSGGTNAATVGTALSDQENRAVGQHKHSLTRKTGAGGDTVWHVSMTYESSIWEEPRSEPVDNSGSVSGTNAPYIQLTWCEKSAGSDYAEWIESSETIEKGMIVSADKESAGHVVMSKERYDETALGVVSTQPGHLIGEETGTTVMLGLAGRVPVKVSLENGNVEIGDKITTSSIPGHGMKATKSGRVVGIAISALDENSELYECGEEMCGEVEVLIDMSWYKTNNNLYALAGIGLLIGIVYIKKRD